MLHPKGYATRNKHTPVYNNNRNTHATDVLHAGLESHPSMLHSQRVFQVFRYRVGDSRNWLTLVAVHGGDTAEEIAKTLKASFGCEVEVKLQDR